MSRWLLLLCSMGGVLIVTVFAGATLAKGEVNVPDEKKCLTCHSDPQLSVTNQEGQKVSLYLDTESMTKSAHRYIDCATCHGTDPHAQKSPLTKLSMTQTCGTCHKYELEEHKESVHGQGLIRGNQDVAGCADCHSPDLSPHTIQQVLRYDSPAYKKNIADTCARCHSDTSLMDRYGILQKTYETYMRSYHGKALQLADSDLRKLNMATCTNCHGVHNIQKTEAPTSPVASLDNLAQTCRQCHSGAEANFAASLTGHREPSPSHFPVVYWTERFFTIFTTSVLAFGSVLVALTVVRGMARGWKNKRE